MPCRTVIVAAWTLLLVSIPGLAQSPALGTAWRDCSDCPEMVSVPAGRFTMGASAQEHSRFGVTPDYAASELPAHEVRIARPIAVGRFVVTRDEWARYVASRRAPSEGEAAPGCAVLTPATGAWAVDASRSWRDPGFAQSGRDPAVCIDWAEAKAYAAWLRARTGKPYRLLSESEWEYAARAGSVSANYWGDDREGACKAANASDLSRAEQHAYSRSVPDSAFLCHDGYVFTAPVDAFAANAFGLYGMSGNVWQWVEDCFSSNYEGAPADGSARLDGDCHYHVDRGASWVNSPRFVRSASRHKDLALARTSVLGLRVARDLLP